MQIQDKTFVVTGGASGLGRAAAEANLAAGGQRVSARRESPTQDMRPKARSARTPASRWPMSRTKSKSAAAVELAQSTFGGLHGVINAAGIGPAAKVIGKNGLHPLDLFERTIRVNLDWDIQRDTTGRGEARRKTSRPRVASAA